MRKWFNQKNNLFIFERISAACLASCLISVFPCIVSLCQVTWTPDTDRGRVRGLQQTANEKLSMEEIRQRGITSLTLHYSQASPKDIQ